MSVSTSVRSWLLFGFLIPSVLVASFVLYHLLNNRNLRKALNNHVIILLLICGVLEMITDLSWQTHYYRTRTALVAQPAFCYIWVYLSGTLYISVYTLMAWGSFERHILIFYPQFFRSQFKRLCFHYLPLLLCILYPAIFYAITFFFLPCSSTVNYNRRFCGLYSCVTNNYWPALLDSIACYILPAFLAVFFSVTLYIRVLHSRYRSQRRIEWRNYRKLSLQLLPISVLYLTLQLPPIILYAAYSAGVDWSITYDYYSDGLYFTYYVVLFTPYASAMSLSDLRNKCRNLFFFWPRRNTAIAPATATLNRSKPVKTAPRLQ